MSLLSVDAGDLVLILGNRVTRQPFCNDLGNLARLREQGSFIPGSNLVSVQTCTGRPYIAMERPLQALLQTFATMHARDVP